MRAQHFLRTFANGKTGKMVAAATTSTTVAPLLFSGLTGAAQHPCTRRYASSTATASQVPKKSFMQWYESHLQAAPVRTKMVTGGFLWGIGDAVAQIVPGLVAHKDQPKEAESTSICPYDYMRTGRAVLFGFALHAPTSHLHFNFLEWMTQKGGFTGLQIPIFKTIMEQFVYWSWVSNSMYHGAMGAMQGLNIQQICDRISDVLWETQKAQWVFWIPIQLLNFNFVPVRHQLNVVLLTSIVWTALLSAWYPPEPEDKKVEERAVESAKDIKSKVDL